MISRSGVGHVCAWLAAVAAAAVGAPLPVVEMAIGPHRLQAELAYVPAARQLGLMYRDSLPPDHGMLFIFPRERRHCMWMRSTTIPLTVAFVDAEGIILSLDDMVPRSEVAICAARPARYALEMRQGWFAERAIRVGQRLGGLDGLPRAR